MFYTDYHILKKELKCYGIEGKLQCLINNQTNSLKLILIHIKIYMIYLTLKIIVTNLLL